MWSLSDESLVAGMASRDAQAVTAFVRRFQGRVFGLAVTILSDRQAAEEAAQETFVRAWRHADAYDARRGAVATWLLTIARNVSIDMLRVRRQEPVDPEVMLTLIGAEPGETPYEDKDRIRSALRTLPAEQLRALVLAAFYGRTAREISEMDDVPIGTVKTRIRTAMSKMRTALEIADDR